MDIVKNIVEQSRRSIHTTHMNLISLSLSLSLSVSTHAHACTYPHLSFEDSEGVRANIRGGRVVDVRSLKKGWRREGSAEDLRGGKWVFIPSATERVFPHTHTRALIFFHERKESSLFAIVFQSFKRKFKILSSEFESVLYFHLKIN